MSVITLVAALWAAITWLLGLSFMLGGYSARQKAAEKALVENRETIKRIFDRLDKLTEEMPRLRIKSVKIAQISERVNSLESFQSRVSRAHEAQHGEVV